MSVSHHPGEDSLLAYATGKLAPGAALTVGVHVEACTDCAEEVTFLERIGGALLEVSEPDAVPEGALDRALAALDTPPPPAPAAASGLPRALAGRRIGPWRWAGPGVRVAWLDDERGEGEQLYLLKVRPGSQLPEHSHRGVERVVVLQGAFIDGNDRFGAGDVSERDDRHRHHPVVAAGPDCICLVATEGRLRLTGVARWLQPLFGI